MDAARIEKDIHITSTMLETIVESITLRLIHLTTGPLVLYTPPPPFKTGDIKHNFLYQTY